jgi:hypothetical protein
MLRRPFLLILLAAGCSKGPEADLTSISEARSLIAEWALVNQQASAGHLTTPYVRTMRQEIRDQLQTTAKSLADPNAPYGREIALSLREHDDAPAAQLKARADRLKQIEDKLESA